MCVIIDDGIAVDCFTSNPRYKNYIHFWTHINRSVQSSSQLSIPEGVKLIYTSTFNVWFFMNIIGGENNVFTGVSIGDRKTVSVRGKKFTFEFLDSHFHPGATMILFEGDFGAHLYATRMRYSPMMNDYPALKPYLTDQVLDRMYLDGTYFKSPVPLPNPSETLGSVIELIKKHGSKMIFISADTLGKEDALKIISESLNKKIYVSTAKMRVLSYIKSADCFTTDENSTNIRTISYDDSHLEGQRRRIARFGSAITIVLSASIYIRKWKKMAKYEKNGIYIFPFTEYNTAREINLFKTKFPCKETILVSSLSFKSTVVVPKRPNKVYKKKHVNSKFLEFIRRQPRADVFLKDFDEYVRWRLNSET